MKVIRIISKSDFDVYIESLFKNLKILKFQDICSFHTLKFVYLFKEGFLPNMNEMFLLTNQLHSYNTRNSNSFHIYYCRTNIRQFGIRFCGLKLINSVTFLLILKRTKNISSFKTKVKIFLLN